MYISVYKLINHNISHSWSHSLFLGVSLVETPLLLPLSCQKKNIRRNFIYNIFLLTFSLTSQGCRSFKLNLEQVSIAGGFLLEKNFPGEGCSVGFRLQFHGFLGVSPRFWLVEDSWRWPAKISSDDSSRETLSLTCSKKLLSWWNCLLLIHRILLS